ncbi:MAG: hypothetical protein ACRCX7_08860 [Cetobacterium sp.]
MRNILEDFEFSNYTTSKEIFLNMINEKRPQDNYDITPKNTEVLFNVLIEEIDKEKKENIFLTGKHLKAMHSDVKNGIFVFRGVIPETDKESLNLVKETMKGKTFNQYIKQIKITNGVLTNNGKINILREYKFKGFICCFYEFYDNKNNYIFEFVICRRKILYRDDIFIKRLRNGMLAIGVVTTPIKIIRPLAKNKTEYQKKIKQGKLKNLRMGSTFWAVSGIALASFAMIGSFGAVSAGALAVTILFGANTIISGSYSIYLDYNDRDNEMGLDTLYNNPLKFAFGKIAENMTGNVSVGHTVYHGSEILLGGRGLKSIIKNFKFKSILKHRTLVKKHELLGNLEGMENVLNLKRVGYDTFQVTDGVRGIYNNTKDFEKSVRGVFKPIEKTRPTFKPITTLGNRGQ